MLQARGGLRIPCRGEGAPGVLPLDPQLQAAQILTSLCLYMKVTHMHIQLRYTYAHTTALDAICSHLPSVDGRILHQLRCYS